MKNLTLTATAVALTTVATGAMAGGLDRATYSPSILFKEGTYAEFSTARTKPKVTPDSFVAGALPSGNDVTEDFTTTQLAFKTDINDKVSIALGYNTNPFGVDINYASLAGTSLDSISSLRANMSSTALNVTAKYKVNDSFSVYAGVKHQTVSGSANVSVPLGADGDVLLSSASDTNFHVGVAYEKPEIALRVAFTYETAAQFAPDVLAVNGGNFNTGAGEINTPKAYLLEFQSGVAKDTLVFGSIRHAKWSDAQVYMSDFYLDPTTGRGAQLSDFDDSTSYTLGVGRRFSDNFSGSLTLTHAPSDCADISLLGPTCNDNTLSVGGEYKMANGAAIAAGVSFRKYDTATSSAGTGSIVFDDDTLMTIGVKVSKSF